MSNASAIFDNMASDDIVSGEWGPASGDIPAFRAWVEQDARRDLLQRLRWLHMGALADVADFATKLVKDPESAFEWSENAQKSAATVHACLKVADWYRLGEAMHPSAGDAQFYAYLRERALNEMLNQRHTTNLQTLYNQEAVRIVVGKVLFDR